MLEETSSVFNSLLQFPLKKKNLPLVRWNKYTVPLPSTKSN